MSFRSHRTFDNHMTLHKVWAPVSDDASTAPPDLFKLVVLSNLSDGKQGKVLVNSQESRVETEAAADDLSCCFCSKTFQLFEQLYQHKISDHKLRTVFRCVNSECMEVFEDVDAYRVHNDVVHSQLSFICQTCNFHTESATALHVHKLHSHTMKALSGKTAIMKSELCETVNLLVHYE